MTGIWSAAERQLSEQRQPRPDSPQSAPKPPVRCRTVTTILQDGSHMSMSSRPAQSADAGQNDRPVGGGEAAIREY